MKKNLVINIVFIVISVISEIFSLILYFSSFLPILNSGSLESLSLLILLPFFFLLTAINVICFIIILISTLRLFKKLKLENKPKSVYHFILLFTPLLFVIVNVILILTL